MLNLPLPAFSGYWIANQFIIDCKNKPIALHPAGLPFYSPVLASINSGALEISDPSFLYMALKIGFFQIIIPEYLIPSIKCILRFLVTFSSLPEYTAGFNSAHPEVAAVPMQGFMIDDRKPLPTDPHVAKQNNQVWRLNLKNGLENRFWQYLPAEVQGALDQYKMFKLQVLNLMLDKMGISPAIREKLTCGVTTGGGDEFALFNDFRVDMAAEIGLRSHKDYGIITALVSPVYLTEKEASEAEHSGLEVFINPTIDEGENHWFSVIPNEKAIIFNFGAALEETLKDFPIIIRGFPPVKLTAAVHRVALNTIRRFSFANFGDPPLSSTMVKLSGGLPIQDNGSYEDFCSRLNKALYGKSE